MLKKILIDALDLSGIAWTLRPWYQGRGVVFALHRVIPTGTRTLLPGNAVTDTQLDEILRCVRGAGWAIVSLDEVPARLATTGQPFACFSLDDGYADNLTTGLPVFEAHDAPFTVFPVVEFLDRDQTPRWQLLDHLLSGCEEVEIQHPRSGSHRLAARTWAEKEDALSGIEALGWASDAEQDVAVAGACESAGIEPAQVAAQSFLSWDQARALAAHRLATIGVHTLTHAALGQLPLDAARWEMEGARGRLEQELGTPIRHIAYPYGSPGFCGPREFELAKELGFATGVTTRRGNLFSEHLGHLLALPRVTVSMVPHAASTRFIRTSLYGARNAVMNRMRRVITD